MELKIYAIKDTVVGEMQLPFYQHNDGEAIRSITNAVNDKNSNAVKDNFQDKQLYYLGTFNSDTGEIKSEIRFMHNLKDLEIKGE